MTDPLEVHRDEIMSDAKQAAREAQRAQPKHAPSPWWRRKWTWVLIVSVLALVTCLVLLGLAAFGARGSASSADQHADRADARASSANVAAQANAAGLEQANRQIRALGGTPVATPVTPSSIPGPAGPGPSTDEIAAAVAGYCSTRSGCTGTPSTAQVTAAVAAYCAAGGCRGQTGTSGSSGAQGESGQPGAKGDTGDAGPGPTDVQIQSAVAAYCTVHGDCTGPAGPKGDTGATGATGVPGRGITSIDCTGLGIDQLVIHYDDGTDQTVPCAVGTSSNPSDTPSGEPS